jgi:Protein of unknown function (DUF3050)
VHLPNFQVSQGDGMIDRYRLLSEQISPIRKTLVTHPVYTELCDLQSLRIVTIPWLPPKDIFSARLVNDIVLAEETDEVSPGRFMSHFDLYLAGMKEIGANIIPIQSFIQKLQLGEPVPIALDNLAIPATTKAFVLSTMEATLKSTHEVAATFLLGREDLIPCMFRRILQSLDESSLDCKQLSLYLERHTHLDEDIHKPMGEQLLKHLCGNEEHKWEQSTIAAKKALLGRISLWNGLTLHNRLSRATLVRRDKCR